MPPRFGGAQTRLLNDLEAVGHLLPLLADGEIETIAPGEPPKRAPLIAINVGTGFNSAVAVPLRTGWTALSAESGHAALPRDARVSGGETVEDILSGPGLAQLRTREGDAAHTIFSETLGLCVRDLVLDTGSWGGVYLCGGVMQNAPEVIGRAAFLEALYRDGPMAERIRRVPVHRITASEPTLKALSRIVI